jgi:hypothetical protein
LNRPQGNGCGPTVPEEFLWIFRRQNQDRFSIRKTGILEYWNGGGFLCILPLVYSSLSPLLIIPAFILDFLCIHPFTDGNGRVSRLLSVLMLHRAHYEVGRYISLERLIEQSKETYYEALQIYSVTPWRELLCHAKPQSAQG